MRLKKPAAQQFRVIRMPSLQPIREKLARAQTVFFRAADAIPAAAPQPTSKRSRGVDHCCKRPNEEAITDESCTSGPSRPIDPPEAMLNSAESDFARVRRVEILPSPSTTASM